MKNLNVSGVSGISYLAVIRPIPQKRVTLLKRGESLCSRNLPSAGGVPRSLSCNLNFAAKDFGGMALFAYL